VSDAEPGIRRLRVGRAVSIPHSGEPPARRRQGIESIASSQSAGVSRRLDFRQGARPPAGDGRDAAAANNIATIHEWRQVPPTARSSIAMVAFGEALPKLRRKLRRDLGLPGLPREKVLAVVVSILDATRVRIGNTNMPETTKASVSRRCATPCELHSDGRAVLNSRGKAEFNMKFTSATSALRRS